MGEPHQLSQVATTVETHQTWEPLLTPPSFASLGVRVETITALAAVGIIDPFPIQELTIPLALAGRDIIGQAKTGTGKTLGFAIPIVQSCRTATEAADPAAAQAAGIDRRPQALVIVPTRELALQVASDITVAGRTRGVEVLAVFGGRAYEPQVAALREGVQVVVGTPGRLLDLHRQRHLDLSGVGILVLDEADEMLDMGFLPDVESLISACPPGRQSLLFSATMPGTIVSLARRFMDNPTHIRATDPSDSTAVVDTVEQHVWRVHPMDKIALLARILQARGRGRTLVFSRTKRRAQRVCEDLAELGFAVSTIHGDLAQQAREKALQSFREGRIDVLTATDVAARGIDIEAVTHVVNYECPEDDKAYVHRVGRTGRAGASGVAVTFVDWEDLHRWGMINRTLGLPFVDPVETYSTSEHVFTGLGIDPGVSTRVGPSRTGSVERVKDSAGKKRGEGGKGAAGRSKDGADKPPRDKSTRDKHPRDKPPREKGTGPGGRAVASDTDGRAASGTAMPPAQRPKRRRRRVRPADDEGAG